MSTKKKYPDNIVYNYETEKFDAKNKAYPTSVGGQKFEPLKVDKSSVADANHYFESKLNELKAEYRKLIDEYNWTSLVYASTYNFQLDTSLNFNNPIVDINNESLIYIDTENINWETTYYWRVRPVDINGASGEWIDTLSFTT